MVIRFLTMRDFLLPELLQQLPVSVVYWTSWRLLLLKNAAHVVQEAGHRIEQQGRRVTVIPLPCWYNPRLRWSRTVFSLIQLCA